jgi:putative transposase
VDTLGLIGLVVVHAANVQDCDGARLVFEKLKHYCFRLVLLWADGAYEGQPLFEWLYYLRQRSRIILEIVKRSDRVKKFKVLPKRWIVERTFGWLGRFRRLSKDYEYLPVSSEAFIKIAMIHLMSRRLAAHGVTF